MLRIFKYHRKLCKIHVTIHAQWPDQFCKCGFCSQFVYSFKNRGLAAKPWAGPKFHLRNQNFRVIILITPQTCIFAHGDVSKWSQRAWLEIKLSARARGFESHRLRHKPGKTSCFSGFILTFGRHTQSAPATNIDMAYHTQNTKNEYCGAKMVPGTSNEAIQSGITPRKRGALDALAFLAS